MRLEFLERHSEGDGPLHRLDPRIKLVVTLAYIIAVVATPIGWWRLLAAEGLVLAFVIGLSGAPPRELLTRWLGFIVLVGFLALMVARAHPSRKEFGIAAVMLTIVAKNSMAFLATLSLVNVTPFRKLLGGMRRLGMPAALVATLQFMYRYLHVLTEELDRMVKARRSRTFRRSGRLDWVLLTGLIGILFLRAFERGERVHAAMLARGWDGTIRTLDDSDSP
ncbi:energy-coupling factor transporter transmembrane component T family protein [Singulisphaera acidiphila]|uniref:ABC-type cobalt transport system, permease component CbiQ n=1 Tax=Singulisphaera acidiphila (strain ATCC BAA-1392 / DSM 18658 / VKM B-2454 / MOB10) TaxID=886293 RepID=L0D7M4_SINAD|nr:energy-coupling factor transporter transmembrane component T [Singulisphaera acidiphila]AGA25252.1 ABC-type cobalt transport system, permease component CbiQ [Singulisphaera acidiphila DSM 18658]